MALERATRIFKAPGGDDSPGCRIDRRGREYSDADGLSGPTGPTGNLFPSAPNQSHRQFVFFRP